MRMITLLFCIPDHTIYVQGQGEQPSVNDLRNKSKPELSLANLNDLVRNWCLQAIEGLLSKTDLVF